MRENTTRAALLATLVMVLAACGAGDRDAIVEDRMTRAEDTQAEAECYADAVIAEFGEDPASDGELSSEDVSKLSSFAADCNVES